MKTKQNNPLTMEVFGLNWQPKKGIGEKITLVKNVSKRGWQKWVLSGVGVEVDPGDRCKVTHKFKT